MSSILVQCSPAAICLSDSSVYGKCIIHLMVNIPIQLSNAKLMWSHVINIVGDDSIYILGW